MKCGETNPDETYQECQKDLEHDGDHEYYSYRWPRPEPAELEEDVEDMILAGARSLGRSREWDLNERDYYIAFEVTETFLVKVSAESEDEALAQFDDGEWPDFSREQSVNCSVDVRRPTEWERSDLDGAPLGPRIACPECGKLSMSPRWFHDPYRKCHGPIQWRPGYNGRAHREYMQTPVHAAPKAVTA
ncbi:hypothetical protein ACFV0B_11160 [Streptomyces xanthophaeus]|uniref:hypothetical protein n=1 Tax=Streptomyces xanthophaeus TaxID=67385 RepID=UPI0036D0FCD0